LEKEAEGKWAGGKWTVTIRMLRNLPAGRQPLARMVLIYGSGNPAMPLKQSENAVPYQIAGGSENERLQWSGVLFRSPIWLRTGGGTLMGRVKACPSADLWAAPLSPRQILPVSQLESALRIALAVAGRWNEGARELVISRISVFPAGECVSIIGSQPEGSWFLADEGGHAAFCLEGIRTANEAGDTSPSLPEAAVFAPEARPAKALSA
jgi:hypothetical protein